MAQTATYPGADVVKRRHVDWRENRVRWQWMLDSYEGGNRYRNAVYGCDRLGLPVRNLVRHKREYPDPREYPTGFTGASGSAGGAMLSGGVTPEGAFGLFPGLMGADPNATAGDDDYELRRSRTPPPEWVATCVETHLSKIYDQEVTRKGPAALGDEDAGWWADVDGCGTTIDDWMTETVAPLLLVYGFLDVAFGHPPAPDGEAVTTQADVLRLGLGRCVASYVLPENMLWYRLGAAREYQECLTLEYIDASEWQVPDSNKPASAAGAEWAKTHARLRHWTADGTVLYDIDGKVVEPLRRYPYGRPPIRRVFDRRRHRTAHVGKSRYEGVAELQREFYNRDSELILSDTIQAHPLLQGPEDFVNADGTVPVGPNWLLPMKKNNVAGAPQYAGFSVVEFPKGGAESLRLNKSDLSEAKDAAAYLTKPAGLHGMPKGTVAQSGVAKQLDNDSGNKVLSKISKVLAKAERAFAEMALTVCLDAPPSPDLMGQVEVVYPSRFDLFDVGEMTEGIGELQLLMAAAGDLPEAETLLIQNLERKLLRNLKDETYATLDAEVAAVIAAKAKARAMAAEGLAAAPQPPGPADVSGEGSDSYSGAGGSLDPGAGSDPGGESNATAVSGTVAGNF